MAAIDDLTELVERAAAAERSALAAKWKDRGDVAATVRRVRKAAEDQREAIRPGIIISHYAFITQDGQQGYAIVSHTTQRAGICFAEGRSEWGRWSEETGTITTDGGRMYNRVGEPLFEVGE